MRKHRDLIAVLKSNKMRITPARRLLVQFILDHKERQLSLKEIQEFMVRHMEGIDRSSIYRNIEALKMLDILQELSLPGIGKRFQYVFDRKVHQFYICKTCGKVNRGDPKLFNRIEAALKGVSGFSKTGLSAVFYGYCPRCDSKGKNSKELERSSERR